MELHYHIEGSRFGWKWMVRFFGHLFGRLVAFVSVVPSKWCLPRFMCFISQMERKAFVEKKFSSLSLMDDQGIEFVWQIYYLCNLVCLDKTKSW